MIRPYRIVNYVVAVSRLNAGDSLDKLARDYGVSKSAISRGARRHGWRGGGKGGRKPKPTAKDVSASP